MGEINRCCGDIERGLGDRVLVIALHGALNPQDQTRAFRPPPRGKTKIVVATNIAETSITIPDCTVVIDSCRVKETGFNAERCESPSSFVSRAVGSQGLRVLQVRPSSRRPGQLRML